MKISFCTTCMNREWQLSKTIENNIESIIDTGNEICLVNFNSKGICDDIVENYNKYIGKELQYFKTYEPKYYSSPEAKNLSHRLARNEIIYNLDCDNFITKKEIVKVIKIFETLDKVIYRNHVGCDYGTYGRIAYKRDDFFNIGGYDEDLKGMGAQDTDLLERFKQLGYKIVNNEINYKSPIQNKEEEKVTNIEEKITFKEVSYRNMILSMKKIKNGDFIRNKKRVMKKFNGYLNFSENNIII